MRRILAVLLCVALPLCLGCKKKRGMTIRAANVTVRSVDGEVVEDLTLTIDPATVRAKRGDAITWTVVAVNNLADEIVAVRAEVVYLSPDAVTMTRSTQADLTIDNAVMGLSFRLYIPDKTGYLWDSLTVTIDGIVEHVAGNPIHADAETGELFLLIELAELVAGAIVTITYTTEVGAQTALPSGQVIESPPPLPTL